jgi:hypothetical protein
MYINTCKYVYIFTYLNVSLASQCSLKKKSQHISMIEGRLKLLENKTSPSAKSQFKEKV